MLISFVFVVILSSAKTAGIEIGKNVGMAIGKKETILKMLNSGMPELDIMKYLGITESDLEEIKKCK